MPDSVPATGAVAEVCKADQVPDRIVGKVQQYRGEQRAPGALSPAHRRVIADFLCKVHKPLGRSPVAEAASTESATSKLATSVHEPVVDPKGALPPKVCKHCGGLELEAHYGKFGYYFVCKGCSKNTGIKFLCPACGGEGRVRKQGKDFFAECKACDASTLLHSNA